MTRSRSLMIIMIGLLCLTALALRLPSLNSAPYNAHSFRQTETMATIDDYYKNGINLLYPKTNYVGYPGYLVFELPVYQAGMAMLWKIFTPQVFVIRLYNILIGFLTAWLVFLFARKWFGDKAGLAAAIIYLFIPLNIVYSRSVLLDPTATLFSLITVYALIRLVETKGPIYVLWLFLLAAGAILTALLKPLYLFPAVIIFIYLCFTDPVKKWWPALAAFALAAVLLFFWMGHARAVNELSPFTSQLAIESHLGINKIFDISYWLTIAFRTATKYAPGPALLLLLFSLYPMVRGRDEDRQSRSKLIMLWVILGGYLLVFAKINAPHDYYQLVLMPYVAALIAFSCLRILNSIDSAKIRQALVWSFCLSFFLASGVTALDMMKNSRSVTVFAGRVSKYLDRSNGYVAVFGPWMERSDNDRGFNDPAYLYSINKSGLANSANDIDDAVKILADQAKYFSGKFGQLIFYHLGDMTEGQEEKIAAFGFKLKVRGDELQIFNKK